VASDQASVTAPKDSRAYGRRVAFHLIAARDLTAPLFRLLQSANRLDASPRSASATPLHWLVSSRQCSMEQDGATPLLKNSPIRVIQAGEGR